MWSFLASIIFLICVACCAEPDPHPRIELAAVDLVIFTGPDGEPVLVSPNSVAALRGQKEKPQGHFHYAVKCVIYTTDGKFVPVTDDCNTVQDKLSKKREWWMELK